MVRGCDQQRYVGKLQNGVRCRGGVQRRASASKPARRLACVIATAPDLALADANEKENDGRGRWLFEKKSR